MQRLVEGEGNRSYRRTFALIAAFIATTVAVIGMTGGEASADYIGDYKHDAQGKVLDIKGTYVGVDVTRKKLKKFGLAVPVACSRSGIGGILFTRMFGPARIKYKPGSQTGNFKLSRKVKMLTPITEKGRVTIKGTIRGRKLSGTVELEAPFGGIGNPEICFTGKAKWKARVGKTVNPFTVV